MPSILTQAGGCYNGSGAGKGSRIEALKGRWQFEPSVDLVERIKLGEECRKSPDVLCLCLSFFQDKLFYSAIVSKESSPRMASLSLSLSLSVRLVCDISSMASSHNISMSSSNSKANLLAQQKCFAALLSI